MKRTLLMMASMAILVTPVTALADTLPQAKMPPLPSNPAFAKTEALRAQQQADYDALRQKFLSYKPPTGWWDDPGLQVSNQSIEQGNQQVASGMSQIQRLLNQVLTSSSTGDSSTTDSSTGFEVGGIQFPPFPNWGTLFNFQFPGWL